MIIANQRLWIMIVGVSNKIALLLNFAAYSKEFSSHQDHWEKDYFLANSLIVLLIAMFGRMRRIIGTRDGRVLSKSKLES